MGVAVTKPAGDCVLEDCEQETPRTTPVTSGAMSQNRELLRNEYLAV